METISPDWSIQQLTEFSSFISGFAEPAAAAQAAIERASFVFDAEAGALVFGDRVGPVVGFPAGQVPAGELVEAIHGERTVLRMPGIGDCRVVVVPIEHGSLERGGAGGL